MGAGSGRRPGKILGLHRFLSEHGEAVEYDLLTLGLDLRLLGTRALTWHRLDAVIQQAADDERSALWRDLAGVDAEFPLSNRLLAQITNSVRLLVWQNTSDATSKQPKHTPKPILPPSEQAEDPAKTATVSALEDFRRRTQQAREA